MLYPTTTVTIIIVVISMLLALAIIVKTSNKKNKSTKAINPEKHARNVRSSMRSLSKSPQDYDSIKKLAESYYELGEWAKAQKAFQRYIDGRDTTHPTASIYQKFGIASIKSNLYPQAYNALRTAYKMDSGSFETNYYLGLIEQRKGNASLAVQFLRNALVVTPTFRPAIRLLGIALTSTGNYRDAKSLLEQSFAHSPKDDEVAFAYANCMKHLGKHEVALRHYKELLSSQRFGALALVALGDMAMISREFDAAKNYYLKAIQVPQTVSPTVLLETYYNLANLYFDAKDIENTTKYLKEIKKHNANYKDVQHRLSLLDNRNLYQYLHADAKAIQPLCEAMLKHIFPHASTAILSRNTGSEYIDFVVEVRDKRKKNIVSYILRFQRTNNEVNDVQLHNLNVRFKETGTSSAICITAGIFTAAAKQYAQSRPIELIDKIRTSKILENV